uniref:HSF-type DNA-binding domain-containing protein n=1 Tax=Globisporangium ultimum (strain ATCC 200006 / CBS 805.95 / DAOM BR144) TaxID=431595 RepID=K3WPE6_GLOUD
MAAGIATGFVRKLYRILDLESDAIISWDPTGRSFSIHDAEQLNERVLPRYFRGRLCAFRQQLVDHGFEQLECEDNETREVYRHDHFLQGCPGQLSLIKRVPKPKRKAPTAVALVMPSAAAVRNGMLQVPARAPSSLTVTLSAGSIGGVKRMNSGAANGGSNTSNVVEPNKRLRMEPPLTVTVTNTATKNGGAVHQNSRTTGIANTNPLFSNEPDAGVLSFARLAESGMLPCSTDLPEPISYLTKMTQAAATTSDLAQQPAGAPARGNRSLAEPPMFSDDLFRSALFYLASSTTGTTDPTEKPNGTSPAGAQDNNEIKTSVDKNGNVSVSSNLLAVLMASSTSCMPPATTSTGNNGSSTWSSNPLFSDQSTGDDDDSEDSIWNLLVASSIDRVKSAIADGQTPQQRLKLILDERERLEEQRKKFTRGAAATTTSVGTAPANTTDGANTTNTQPPAVQKKPLNPLFAAKTTTRASNPVAPPTAAPPMPSNPLFAKPASVNPLFAKSSSSTAIASAATSNPLFAKTATTTASAGATAPTTSNPLFAKASSAVAPRANSHEDDLWRLLMSSSIDSFRRVGEFEV